MGKIKSRYVCQQCGAFSFKWQGKCNNCDAWNSLVEEIVVEQKQGRQTRLNEPQAVKLTDIIHIENKRIISQDDEFNRVLGGGIVSGSLVLLGGEPGIGKSTLLLQVAMQMSLKVLYIAGEESPNQIKLRAERIGNVQSECFLLAENDVEIIVEQAKTIQPDLIIVDSIQTLIKNGLESAPGTVAQVRETANVLHHFAKTSHIPIFLIGHITKDGSIAGPKVLEHLVDVVLQFEGERNHLFRVLRSIKNRFGAAMELGIYEMRSDGLAPVNNPSEILLGTRNKDLSGNAVAVSMEGLRPILIETQALVSPAIYGTPQRNNTGYDLKRLHMLLAVLDKRCGFRFGTQDVFLNFAGGIKVEDTAIDLAITAALLSSYSDVAINLQYCFAGEVGLNGEIRPISRVEQRIHEAEKLGFNNIFLPITNIENISKNKYNINIQGVEKISDLVKLIFG
jgi:DNA repair protein RadA/Sms